MSACPPHHSPDIEELHTLACQRGAQTYTDPATGFQVFTADALRARRKCCGCGCRHCLDAFPDEGLAALKRRGYTPPKCLHGNLDDLSDNIDILFWSGGKDSYLALRSLARETADRDSILLLTTFDANSRTVAHQEVCIDVIVRQAAALALPLLAVPLAGAAGDYLLHIRRALAYVREKVCVRVRRLVFGDLHLQHVRAWRDAHLADAGAAGSSGKLDDAMQLHYPLWRMSYAKLRDELRESGVVARVCAVGRPDLCEEVVRVGDEFGDALLERLPDGVDQFGEEGEFHSIVEVWREGLKSVVPWKS